VAAVRRPSITQPRSLVITRLDAHDVSSHRSAVLHRPPGARRIGSLELVARTVVNGFVGGPAPAPTFGSTTDFAEHRAYMAGDDTRRVDWRLYARTDRLHVKEFEADTNTSVSVLLDVSRSMSYASTPGALSKLDYGPLPRRVAALARAAAARPRGAS
jgi:uncharacterized protein (DUF58 family)